MDMIRKATTLLLASTLSLNALQAQEVIGTHRLSRDSDGWYCHNVVATEFKGRLYAQWQCSDKDEDAPDTRIYYSRSEDGRHWSVPEKMDISLDSVKFISNGGWWNSGDSLLCFINVARLDGSRECLYTTSADGDEWNAPRPVTDFRGQPVSGIIEQDTRRLPDGRILTAFHIGKDMICTPYYTDDPSAKSGWKAGTMPHLSYEGKSTSREIEPSWYLDRDGAIVMIFRDQAGSFRKLRSSSTDRVETWTLPELTDIEDSRSKQSAGHLPDGRAFMVWNPSESKDRLPLTLAIQDGQDWIRYTLRSEEDLTPMRHEGLYKRRGYSYPKTFVWNNILVIGYAENKEDACVTLVRIRNK
mgnify:FL=1